MGSQVREVQYHFSVMGAPLGAVSVTQGPACGSHIPVRVIEMQSFCLKLYPMIGLQDKAGLRVFRSSGSWAVGGIKSAGVAEAPE